MAPKILDQTGYVSLGLCLVTTSIMIIIFHHLHQNVKDKYKSKSIIFGYTSIIFYILYGVNIMILSICNITTTKSTFSGIICIYGYLHPLLFQCGKIFMFLFYLRRLYCIFDGTSMQYSRKKFKAFGMVIIIGYSLPSTMLSVLVWAGLYRAIRDDSLSSFESWSDCNHFSQFQFSKPLTIIFTTAILGNALIDLVVPVLILRFVF